MPVTRSLVFVGLAIELAGCGAHHAVPAPPKPKPIDTKQLAHDLHDDLRQLATIASHWRGHCPELVAELRPHVVQMRAHAAVVEQVKLDPALAVQLKAEMVAVYDEEARGLADTIGNDLAASWQTCKDNPELQRVIDQIPEL